LVRGTTKHIFQAGTEIAKKEKKTAPRRVSPNQVHTQLSFGRQTMRVLIGDDNRDAADTLATILRLWGHEVRVAYDGTSALVVAHLFRPHVALLDIEMPKMNGGEVALNLRRQAGLEGMILVAESASDPTDVRLARYDRVFDAYLGKPCDLQRLEELLQAGDSRAFCRRRQKLVIQEGGLAEV
jgi:DNA-binding response OmpR family regulator